MPQAGAVLDARAVPCRRTSTQRGPAALLRRLHSSDIAEQLAIDRTRGRLLASSATSGRARARGEPSRLPRACSQVTRSSGVRAGAPGGALSARIENQHLHTSTTSRPPGRRGRPDRHGRGRQRIAHKRKPKLLLAGWSTSPAARLRALPRDRRRGRRAADGRHGALRRPRRRGPPSVAGAARRRRHKHDAQDDRRRARRPDPLQAAPEEANWAIFPPRRPLEDDVIAAGKRWR